MLSSSPLPTRHKSLREGYRLTTIVASNIHCPSCNVRIQEVLHALDVADVTVNITTGEVKVLHPPNVAAEDVCDLLSEESYEPYSATTVDKDGAVVYEQNFTKGKSWFSRGLQECTFSTARARHIDNCEACRTKVSSETSSQHTQPKVVQTPAYEVDREGSPRVIPETGATGGGTGSLVALNTQKSGINQVWNLTLSVDGMTCASCTSSVSQAAQEMDSVESVKVDLLSNSCMVKFTGSKEYSKKIVETIEEKGYDVEITELRRIQDDGPVRAKLSIGGMTCASCTNSVTDGLKQLPFVESVKVTLMTNSAVVDFIGLSHLEELREEVEEMGFECSVDSWEALASSKAGISERQVDLKVDGMFCNHCPGRIVAAIESKFRNLVRVVKEPDMSTGILTVKYTPDPPGFTVRSIIAVIQGSSDSFKAHVYHPPSIEERSKRMQARERKRILYRLIFSGIAAIPTLLIGVIWMDLDKTSAAHRYLMGKIWNTGATRSEWALAFIATPVLLYSAGLFHTRAIKEIRSLWRPGSKTPILKRFYRFGSMNLLISAGTLVAYFASIAQLIMDTLRKDQQSGMTYFDAVVFLTFFILIGRYLEAVSKSKTGDAVSMLGKLKPDQAILSSVKGTTDASNGFIVNADELEVGDLVIVPQGSSPPADGIIVAGEGSFDEKSLTGESRLVLKKSGDEVFTGTISAGDPVTIRVTKVGGTSMLDQIVTVVREGLGRRAPIERYADVLTAYFVPAITAAAIVTWITWLTLGYSGALREDYLKGQAGGWAFWSLDFAIAVFVTACPCGIGLAAPTALFAGIGLAAQLGILVQGGGEAFQEAPHLDAVVFDKTGTLTEGGDIKVSNERLLYKDEQERLLLWSIVHKLEEQSSHPIARAITELSSDKATAEIEVESISEIPGRGLRGVFSHDGIRYEGAIGSQKHMTTLCSDMSTRDAQTLRVLSTWQKQSKSVAIFALRNLSEMNSKWTTKALFATADPVRPSAAPTIKELQRRGLSVFMLSGDHILTAKAVGTSLGIPETNIFAGVLPTEKAEKIEILKRTLRSRRKLKQIGYLIPRLRLKLNPTVPEAQYSENIDLEARNGEGKLDSPSTKASIAFVGDGINDAPALIASSLSISMGSGAQVAMNSSQFILLQSDLELIPKLIDLSSMVYRRIKINFGWALVYNVILVPIAAGVLFRVRDDGWRLGPVWASLAMALSSVSVVLSSLALKWEGQWRFRRERRSRQTGN